MACCPFVILPDLRTISDYAKFVRVSRAATLFTCIKNNGRIFLDSVLGLMYPSAPPLQRLPENLLLSINRWQDISRFRFRSDVSISTTSPMTARESSVVNQ
ncbi:hypothetical protein CDAR_371921 [Caerostris darwini]|uniref:Uncharacterized protein n=1 Tax=Caerostris darwini TaxID=1538125 RepID=A0AAV4W0W2_9ARAC|nr:hypothetical protein CDAR_371921 [Caerostris darwini]